jgi:hypothetical protein
MDGYITFRLQWSGAVSDDQQLGLIFRMDGPNFYQLSVTGEGDVSLWRADSDGLTQMSQVRVRDVEVVEQMVLGLLFVGEEMRVFVNDDLRITTSDAASSQGSYHLELRGQNAGVRITRFEVKVPPEQVDSVLGGQ